ncbi:MAG: YggS family pyridoxal phosphate-dependent enzyme [Proteobacteria bacterium]|nr:YggS family pyridoxal phosphate-dependent enzyme [Pseudomonadota bacterium]
MIVGILAEDRMNENSAIAANLVEVERLIAASAAAAGRDPAGVTLVAVSKTHPQSAVREALAAGHRIFGENRVQEAAEKFPALRADFPDLRLHLIGPLQTNKVRDAVQLFDVIETVDRPRLRDALAREAVHAGRDIAVMVQVNTGEEPQKAGILPADADAFIETCRAAGGLALRGLMCIPPVGEEPAMHFALLAEMAKRHGLEQLSMGMSADFEIAIRLGATHVRVGTAIFGHRPPP